jgi:hypothetical protein
MWPSFSDELEVLGRRNGSGNMVALFRKRESVYLPNLSTQKK